MNRNERVSFSSTMATTVQRSACMIALLMLTVAVFLFLLPAGEKLTHAPSQPTEVSTPSKARVVDAYGRLPMRFESNQGQMDGRVKFVARGSGYTLFLTLGEAVVTFSRPSKGQTQPTSQIQDTPYVETNPRLTRSAVLQMRLVGANPAAQIHGLQELPGKSNYFIGNDPDKWRTNVPNYAKVRYEYIYPGVDLVFYGSQRQLEYDFVVAPGADPNAIRLSFKGLGKLRIDGNGDLILDLEASGDRVEQLCLHKPRIYQEINGTRQAVPGGYRLFRIGPRDNSVEARNIGFEVQAFDATRPLIIDPVLSYSTYLGGVGNDFGSGIAVDSSGNTYVTGITGSSDFPTTAGSFQKSRVFDFDAFVAKLNAAGSALIYSTYLGGNGNDQSFGIAIDSSGNTYLTGSTSSTDFPTTSGAFQTTCGTDGNCNGGAADAFITKLNATGSALVYSTYLGGPGVDFGNSIAVDSSTNAYVTGFASPSFPTTPGAFLTSGPGVYVAKLNPMGSALAYSTFLGPGTGRGLALDSSDNAYVTGVTTSTAFPVVSPFQAACVIDSFGRCQDAFVSKLNATGSALVYSTYLGGNHDDFGFAIAVDAAGNAYATGWTASTDFPVTPGAFQTSSRGDLDIYVTKFDPSGSALVYSTYLGGSQREQDPSIALDLSGNAYVTGSTTSVDFPTANPIQSTCGSCLSGISSGLFDAFVTKLNATGSGLIYSTFIGGNNDDRGNSIAVDSSENAYVTGQALSLDFPTANPLQPANADVSGRTYDAFIAKVVPAPAPAVSITPPSLTFAAQVVGTTSAPQSVTLSNSGNTTLTITSITVTDFFAQTNNCGASVAAGASCTISVTFKATTAGERTGAVTIMDNAPGSPQRVALLGTGSDFSVSASPSSATIMAGQSANYTLSITPAGGFNQTVMLSCTGAPAAATCTFSPASVTPDGTNAATASVTVNTTARSISAPGIQSQVVPPRLLQVVGTAWLACLLGLTMLIHLSRVSGRRVWLSTAVVLLLAVLCISCGGGGAGGAQPLPQGTPAGTSTVTLTGSSGSISHITTVTLTVN